MNQDDLQAHRKAIEIAKARIMEEAAAKAAALEHDFAELQRLAAKLNVPLGAPAVAQVPIEAAVAPADLTMSALIAAYRFDPSSPFHKVHFKTRENYDNQLRRLERELGPKIIAEFDDEEVQKIRAGWSADGHLAMTDALTGMLRMLASYGASALKSKECRALKAITAELNTRSSKPRTVQLTADQVRAIIAKAHAMDRASVALAQAVQFECALKQAVVIGAWAPIGEKGPLADITADNMKWLPGLRWSSVDFQRLIFRHPQGEVRLDDVPLVKEQLAHRSLSNPPASDPLIIYERTGLPYQSYQFRREWRLIADAAGIPKDVKNMDSRAGTRAAARARREAESARG
jgi:hypothetical protein